MKANIGTIDRVLRLILGAVLIGLSVTEVIGWWGWLGAVPLLTGMIRFCPLYTILGFKTCSADSCDTKK